MWIQRLEEAQVAPVVISADSRNLTFHSPINRGIRYQTLICCITAVNDADYPLFVSFALAVRQVFDQGVREAIDF
jgi:hypothetical protein